MSDDTHGNIESLNHYFDEDSSHIMNFGPTPESASSMTRPTPYLSNGDFFAASTSGCADTAASAWL
jgi:hypothetical protein